MPRRVSLVSSSLPGTMAVRVLISMVTKVANRGSDGADIGDWLPEAVSVASVCQISEQIVN